jgi:DNA polymerase III alpha subunit (gram-positive type)
MLAGKAIRGNSIPIEELKARLLPCGCHRRSLWSEVREVRGNAKIAEFNITDYTGSHDGVTKFIKAPEDAVYEKISNGMYVTVQGRVSFNPG